jgi:ABC-2 type transport system ATP-binding protein
MPRADVGRRRDPNRLRIAAESLSKDFGGTEVIRSVDLAVEPGQIVGLIGPSGCGKTTTVRLLLGLLTPTDGVASIGGRPSVELSAVERSRIGYLPQTPALFPELSLVENLNFHASMYGLPLRRAAAIDRVLRWVELDEHRSKRVADASGGMQRRLALAAAFVHDPDVVFLDEPTAGIDPILRDKLWQRFRAARDEGTTVLVTTQYVGEAGECDVVGLLGDGELLMFDTPERLRLAAYGGEVVDVVLVEPATDEQVRALRDVPCVVGDVLRRGAHGLRVVVDDADGAAPAIRAALEAEGLVADDICEHVVDYDEAFVQVVERHRRDAHADHGRAGDGDPDDDPVDDGDGDGDGADRPDTVAGAAGHGTTAGHGKEAARVGTER